MMLHLATVDGKHVPLDRPALINSMACDLVAASFAGVDISDTEDERDAIQWLQAAGWRWRVIKLHLDEARELAQQHLVTACMVPL